MKVFRCNESYTSSSNTILETINIDEYVSSDKNIESAWINIGGWQSWNPCVEVAPNEKQPSLKCHLLYQWNKYLVFPESKFKESKNMVLGQFISYLRWDNSYLFFVSTGNINNELPPVQFIFNRKTNEVSFEIADKGKEWKQNELQAEISVFTAESYFEAQDELKKLFGTSDKSSELYSERFNQIQFLDKTAIGWESWYNHYSNIDSKLICDDLDALQNTENFISIIKNKTTPVFQIDDGWETQLGNWDIHKKRFPFGLKEITEKIEKHKYIPGLWIAPFIIDLRSPVSAEHPDWLLRNNKGHLIPAGFNPLWGPTGTFYALDLSNDDVLDYLDSVIERAINEWGFRYLKLDFLYAGMIYGAYKNKGASYEWYTRAINKLTSRKTNKDGQNVTYLGCGLPLELSFKQFPLSRIGCDTREHWENKPLRLINWTGRNSAYYNLKDTLGHAIIDKIVFANDPDVIFIRNENCTLNRDEKILIATVNIIFGSQIMYSDDPAKSCSDEEIMLAKEINEIRNKYENETFSVIQVSNDLYKIQSKSGKYNGEINLGKEHYIKISENNQI